jgi:hypothetical protein
VKFNNLRRINDTTFIELRKIKWHNCWWK